MLNSDDLFHTRCVCLFTPPKLFMTCRVFLQTKSKHKSGQVIVTSLEKEIRGC